MNNPEQAKIDADQRKAIYEQDGHFYRYRDGLMWGRFQTAATLEAALLYGLYVPPHVENFEKVMLTLFVTAIIAIVFRLAHKDAVDCMSHLDRIADYESVAPYRRPKWWGPHGYGLTRLAMVIIFSANAFLLAKFLTLAAPQ